MLLGVLSAVSLANGSEQVSSFLCAPFFLSMKIKTWCLCYVMTAQVKTEQCNSHRMMLMNISYNQSVALDEFDFKLVCFNVHRATI